MKRPTVSDVAKAAGVSISTVSRVMNGNDKVDEVLAERVRKAAETLRYFPNPYARGIRTKDKTTIGMILPNAGDAFFSKMLEAVLDKASALNYHVMVFSGHGDTNRERECIAAAASAGLDGLLYTPSTDTCIEEVRRIFPQDFPSIIVYRRGLGNNTPQIYHDNEQGGYLATKYLLRLGRKKIAFFASFWEAPTSDASMLLKMLDSPRRGIFSSIERLAGYVSALKEEGIPVDPGRIIFSGFTFDSGYASAERFLSTLKPMDAALCGNDAVAAGVLQKLREQNMSVPGMVSLIGYDDSVFATVARPMLTSVRQDPAQIGREAVEMLDARMRGEAVEDRIIPAELIIRQSTAFLEDSGD
ncbi:MAG: LacI family transcriptional regulator [Clostridiales bacterium]|jgi:LacI family transcriptional regulator|nr:LacI family transcriptional regulator [Clostridiales bacterium]